MRRARSGESKNLKRSAILRAARGIVEQSGFSLLTIEGVTKKSGVAKGTFYVYFQIREDIILALLEEDFGSWFRLFDQYLQKAREPFGSNLVKFWLKSVQDRPLLLSGVAYLHSAIEPSAAENLIYRFKIFLFECIKQTHYRIIQRFQPYVSIETLSHFLTILTGISVGLWQQSVTSLATQKVFKNHPELRLFKGDFEFHFKISAFALIESQQFQPLRQLSNRSGG